MARAGDCWWFAPAPAQRKAAQLRLPSWHQSLLNGHHTISLAVDSFKSPTDRRQPHAFPGPTDSDGNQGVSRAGFSSFVEGERRHPVGVLPRSHRVSDRDVRGGSAAGCSKQMGAVGRLCAPAGRDFYYRIFGGAFLSADVLCFRVGDGER